MTPEQIVDSIIDGRRELHNFPELSSCDWVVKQVIEELISRVRPLTLQARQLECKLERINNMKLNQKIEEVEYDHTDY